MNSEIHSGNLKASFSESSEMVMYCTCTGEKLENAYKQNLQILQSEVTHRRKPF